MRKLAGSSLLALLLLLGAGDARAQIAWDSPMLAAPGPQPGLGLFLIDASRGGVGAMVTWRAPGASLGFRVGVADAPGGVGALAGLDLAGALTRQAPDFPLNIDWVFGAGIGVDDRGGRISFPLGLSAGHLFRAEGVTFSPYLTPRVVLDALFGDADGLDLEFAMDLGLDLAFQPTWMIRFGATFVNRSALAIGIVF